MIFYLKCHPLRNANQSSQPILNKETAVFAGSQLLLTTLKNGKFKISDLLTEILYAKENKSESIELSSLLLSQA